MDLQVFLEKIKHSLTAHLGLEDLQVELHFDFPIILLPKDKVHPAIRFLKNHEEFRLNFLTTMCGIHFFDKPAEDEFGLIYQLHNMSNNTRVRIRTTMSKDDMIMPTITDLFAGANWMEREAFDFYGFQFTGHPNLIRILNMEEMNYFPMRKEYALEDEGRTDKSDKYFGR